MAAPGTIERVVTARVVGQSSVTIWTELHQSPLTEHRFSTVSFLNIVRTKGFVFAERETFEPILAKSLLLPPTTLSCSCEMNYTCWVLSLS